MSLEIKVETADNLGLLAFLRAMHGAKPLYARPSSHPDPYMGCGCHPDVVQRLWDQLGRGLSEDCRTLIFHHPALVHPGKGTIIGLCLGTQYALRLGARDEETARTLGLKSVVQWSSGELLDVQRVWGTGWIWGGWKSEEKEWVAARVEA